MCLAYYVKRIFIIKGIMSCELCVFLLPLIEENKELTWFYLPSTSTLSRHHSKVDRHIIFFDRNFVPHL